MFAGSPFSAGLPWALRQFPYPRSAPITHFDCSATLSRVSLEIQSRSRFVLPTSHNKVRTSRLRCGLQGLPTLDLRRCFLRTPLPSRSSATSNGSFLRQGITKLVDTNSSFFEAGFRLVSYGSQGLDSPCIYGLYVAHEEELRLQDVDHLGFLFGVLGEGQGGEAKEVVQLFGGDAGFFRAGVGFVGEERSDRPGWTGEDGGRVDRGLGRGGMAYSLAWRYPKGGPGMAL